jgi:hypothetical protein
MGTAHQYQRLVPNICYQSRRCIFTQFFWYSFCQLVGSRRITNSVLITQSMSVCDRALYADGIWYEELPRGASDPAACVEIATLYTNHVVENFESRLCRFLIYLLQNMFPVSHYRYNHVTESNTFVIFRACSQNKFQNYPRLIAISMYVGVTLVGVVLTTFWNSIVWTVRQICQLYSFEPKSSVQFLWQTNSKRAIQFIPGPPEGCYGEHEDKWWLKIQQEYQIEEERERERVGGGKSKVNREIIFNECYLHVFLWKAE